MAAVRANVYPSRFFLATCWFSTLSMLILLLELKGLWVLSEVKYFFADKLPLLHNGLCPQLMGSRALGKSRTSVGSRLFLQEKAAQNKCVMYGAFTLYLPWCNTYPMLLDRNDGLTLSYAGIGEQSVGESCRRNTAWSWTKLHVSIICRKWWNFSPKSWQRVLIACCGYFHVRAISTCKFYSKRSRSLSP